jgi:NAD(P)-dependent dehydrogenase (short-subunit alcohol dehydrogenase family)
MKTFMDSIKGLKVIITGGSKGIGKGCAKVFCEAGADVVICSRNESEGELTAREISEKSTGKCEHLKCDVSNPDEVNRLVEYTIKIFGKLDCIINNAGYYPPQRLIDEISIEEFRQIIDTNLIGLFAGCKFALPYLRSSGGSIINMGSVIGSVGQEGASIYTATKGAISSLTKSLAIDEARNGVRVNAVLPGNIISEMYNKNRSRDPDPEEFDRMSNGVQWMGRGGTIEEVGNTCLFLASSGTSFITGAEIYITGGYELGEGQKIPYLKEKGIRKS